MIRKILNSQIRLIKLTSSDKSAEEKPDEKSDQTAAVEMTPEIDAGFAQLARERIASHRFRYYVWLPIKRAQTMWCDTHTQYWPFEGTLLPLEDLDYEHHQQYWLPLFAGLTALLHFVGIGRQLGAVARAPFRCAHLAVVGGAGDPASPDSVLVFGKS
jgi:hypothetical protein